ncbi:MAG: BatD family protein, partial [Lentimonas sp.]
LLEQSLYAQEGEFPTEMPLPSGDLVDVGTKADAPDTIETVPADEAEVVLPVAYVTAELSSKTRFTDRVANAVVWFDEPVEEAEDGISGSNDVSILEVNTFDEPNSKTGKYAAVIRFLPRKTGSVTLPELSFKSETTDYRTHPINFKVSQPIRSENMSLTLTPVKQRVYTGEPVKLSLAWECTVNAAELKSLRLYPDFFNNSSIEVIIPRNTDDEKTHVGLPLGGRRVIATRTLPEEKSKALGTVELPLYLRFTEPGIYTLPETRLECVRLDKAGSDFARYAAHFNNALFESVEADQSYTRIYTTAPAIEIEVLPLPANNSGIEYSGLVAPIDFEVTAQPTEIEIGQLLEMEIKVSGNAPHGMIELPLLSHQNGLRERFLVDNDLGRIWHKEGTSFRTRLRPLSTTIQALPSLHFLVLNPDNDAYEIRSTKAIALKTLSSEGQDFIPLKNFKGAAITLTNQPEGIWHNLKANRMNDLLNTLFDLLSRNFWLCLVLGPMAFLCIVPIVKERRRRANDRNYRLRADAYKRFKRATNDSPEKWSTFLDFMAAHFECSGKAWTLSDSVEALRSVNASDADIAHISSIHKAADARDFSSSSNDVEFAQLDSVARQVLKGIGKLSIVLLLASQLLTPEVQASDWSEAEQLFTQAQGETAGSNAANALYQQAALKFQSEAAVEKHPGESWVNAGNAWFQADAIGRAIAAYQNALNYRPFDPKLSENLAAARAMTLNDIPEAQKWWQCLPTRWLKAVVAIISLLFWASLLLTVRYRSRRTVIASALCAICLLTVSIFLLQKTRTSHTAGVVIVDALYAKKGPNHSYANTFNEPLHDGAEFVVIEQQDDWSFVELSDGRQCWILSSQTTTFSQ